MITTFSFYNPSAGDPAGARSFSFRRRPGKNLEISIPIEHDELDRRGYLRSAYSYMQVVTGQAAAAAVEATTRPALEVRANCVARAKGDGSHRADVLLITLCKIVSEDRTRFLDQFRRTLGFMQAQPGFVASRLFEDTLGDSARYFINVAWWAGVSSFEQAFGTREFQRLVAGGFQPTSEIMLARLPVVWHQPEIA